MSTRFDLNFSRRSSKYRLPTKLFLLYFTRKVSTVTFSEGVYALSPSINDKTSNIFATTRFSLTLVGSFSIDDGNGSENVSFNMNSRFFKLCRVYSNLLKMASVGKFPWS